MEIRFCSPAIVQPGAPALAWRGDGGGGFFPSSHFKATSEYTLTTDVDPQAPPAELHQRSISIHSTLSPAKHCTCPTHPPLATSVPPVSSLQHGGQTLSLCCRCFSGVGGGGCPQTALGGGHLSVFLRHGVKIDVMMRFLTCKHADAPPL